MIEIIDNIARSTTGRYIHCPERNSYGRAITTIPGDTVDSFIEVDTIPPAPTPEPEKP